MTTPEKTAYFDSGGPAMYRIVTQGRVSENWQRRLGGMEITTSSGEASEPRLCRGGPGSGH